MSPSWEIAWKQLSPQQLILVEIKKKKKNLPYYHMFKFIVVAVITKKSSKCYYYSTFSMVLFFLHPCALSRSQFGLTISSSCLYIFCPMVSQCQIGVSKCQLKKWVVNRLDWSYLGPIKHSWLFRI